MRRASSTTQDTHRETGKAWDATAAKYEREEADDIAFLRAGNSSLLEPERRILGDLAPWCECALHLQCAGGTDTLSLLTQGATHVVGVDISPRMIAVAQRKTAALHASATWHVSDVLDTPRELNETANLVYTGRGALPWMQDIRTWAAVCARLIKPNGKLFVFEGHPLDWVWNETAPEYRLDAQHGDYFDQATRTERWPAPFLAEQNDSPTLPAYERHHTLSDIVSAVIEAGLVVEHFAEHPDLYWNQFPQLPAHLAPKLPHTFSLLLRKP